MNGKPPLTSYSRADKNSRYGGAPRTNALFRAHSPPLVSTSTAAPFARHCLTRRVRRGSLSPLAGSLLSLYSAAALTAPQGGGNARRRYLVRAINCPLSITSKVCALAMVVRPLCGLTKTPHWGVFPPLLFGCLRGAPLRTLRARSAAATPPPAPPVAPFTARSVSTQGSR